MKWFEAGRMYLAGLRMGLTVRVTWLRPKAGDLVHLEFRAGIDPARILTVSEHLAKVHPGVDFVITVPALISFHTCPEGVLPAPPYAPVEN